MIKQFLVEKYRKSRDSKEHAFYNQNINFSKTFQNPMPNLASNSFNDKNVFFVTRSKSVQLTC